MNWKTWIPVVLAVTLGLVAAKVGRDLVLRGRISVVPSGKSAPMVMARQDLVPGRELCSEDLTVGQIAGERTPDGVFANPADLVGRVALAPLTKGQPILEILLAPKGSGTGLQALVPAGMRAITIEVNEFSGVAGLLVPGCHVDVMVTLRDEKTQESLSRSIVENVKVTAVGQRLSAAGPNSVEGSVDAAANANNVKSVTLVATPKEAAAIELACSAGRPRLVLRNGSDESSANDAHVSLAELRGQEASPPSPVQPVVQAKAPEVPTTQPVRRATVRRTVQLIRAGVATTETFEIPVKSSEHQISAAETDLIAP